MAKAGESELHVQVERTYREIFARLGGQAVAILKYLGGLARLAFLTIVALFRYRFDLHALVEQLQFVGVKSLTIVNLIAIFVGMVFALQFAVGLGRFGLKIYIGQIIGLAICRELGPVLTAVMLAARVGAGIAAELGSMVVTEQVLAIEALGADPVHKLVLPRVLATTLAAPLLTVVANLIGVFGGMIVTVMEAGVTPHFYWDQVRRTVELEDFLSGVTKTVFFGFAIALISCFEGLRTRGGTAGVGQATTHAVVFSSVTVFVMDFFLTKLFLFF